MTLDKFCDVSKPQFLHLKMGVRMILSLEKAEALESTEKYCAVTQVTGPASV